jgi:hypothetical protein
MRRHALKGKPDDQARSSRAGTEALRIQADGRFLITDPEGVPVPMSAHFSEDALAQRIRECVLELLIERGPGRTIGVSEAAQALGARIGYHWHDLMRPVRTIAAAMTDAGTIEALQHEAVVDIRDARGPVRLRLRALPGQRSAQRS